MSHCEQGDDGLVYVSRRRGDSLRLTVDLGADTGDVDISGWTFLAQVRDAADALLATMTATPIDPLAGIFQLDLSGSQTAAMPLGDHDFDVEASDLLGGSRTVVNGQLRIREDTSHA